MIFLKEERKRLNLTQGDVAKICGVTIRAVSKWETGKATIKSTYLELLSQAGFDTNYILTGIKQYTKADDISTTELLDNLEMLVEAQELIMKNHETQIKQMKLLISKIRRGK